MRAQQSSSVIAESFRLIWRILTFQATEEELDLLGARHLLVGLPLVWLVGFGRWWDEPRDISLLHRSGLGSVVYVIALAMLLYLIALPLAESKLNYFKMLAFVSFTAPPAALYALPVEMWVSREAAVGVNIAFLLIVSVYRVSLLIWFYVRGLWMGGYRAALCALLPIGAIAVGITYAGFGERIIAIMGGLRDNSPATEAFGAVAMISCFSLFSTPVLLIAWAFSVTQRRQEREVERVRDLLD